MDLVESTFLPTGDGRLASSSVAAINKDISFIALGFSYPVLMKAHGALYYRVVENGHVGGPMNGEGVEGRLDDF
jgi:hypothetical protein